MAPSTPSTLETSRRYPRPMVAFAINPGVDHRNTVGKGPRGSWLKRVSAGGWSTRTLPAMRTHCPEPVAWVGRWKFLKGWAKVWSCERHADGLVGARRTLGG